MKAPTPRPSYAKAGVNRDAGYVERAQLQAVLGGVASPAGNVSGTLNGGSTIAVIERGRLVSTTLDDIGAVVGGGGGTYTAGSIDFGSSGFDASVEINDGTVSVASSIVIVPKDTDGEAQWDGIVYSAETFNGRFVVRAVAVPGPVSGTRDFLYRVVS